MRKHVKKFAAFSIMVGLSVISSTTALAGEWKSDSIGWWYLNDDGSYPKSTSKEIDGTVYKFDGNGYWIENENNTIHPEVQGHRATTRPFYIDPCKGAVLNDFIVYKSSFGSYNGDYLVIANLDGSNKQIIVNENGTFVNGIYRIGDCVYALVYKCHNNGSQTTWLYRINGDRSYNMLGQLGAFGDYSKIQRDMIVVGNMIIFESVTNLGKQTEWYYITIDDLNPHVISKEEVDAAVDKLDQNDGRLNSTVLGVNDKISLLRHTENTSDAYGFIVSSTDAYFVQDNKTREKKEIPEVSLYTVRSIGDKIYYIGKDKSIYKLDAGLNATMIDSGYEELEVTSYGDLLAYGNDGVGRWVDRK